MREETGAKYKYSIFPKNTMANLKTHPQQELLLTLKQATTAEQLALAGAGIGAGQAINSKDTETNLPAEIW